ncbi:MAG: hypothetical protein KGO05_11205 [Chloroflexota bacterium]|nr:hypothetical protein [Chloroflexota bacterium]
MHEGDEPVTPMSVADDSAPSVSSLDAPPSAGAGPRAGPAVRSHRSRALRVAAPLATALLVIATLVGLFARSTSDPSGALGTLLDRATPTPNATFVPGANIIYISNAAPWGTLTIDGRRLPSLALVGATIHVQRGTHHLVYQARYFPTVRCVFSAPRALSDTCPLDTSQDTLQFLLDQGLARVINLGSTGATLRDDQRIALIQLINTQLAAQSAQATIAPGERYLDGQGRLATASAPLTFRMTLALGGSNIPGQGSTCYQLCPDPSFTTGQSPDPSQWTVRVTLDASWAITDASGQRLTPLMYQAGQPYPQSDQLGINVALTGQGWAVSGLGSQSANMAANAAFATLGNAVSAAGASVTGAGITLGQNALAGCVLSASVGSGHVNLLWRFGALFALDTAAQRVFPLLPLANAAERAAASDIQAHPAALGSP